jgi:PAS domain-containing protein
VLPVRHLLALRDKTPEAAADADPAQNSIPSWVQDFALSLLDVDGQIVAWYGGSERIYQYTSREAVSQNVTLLNPEEDPLQVAMHEELKRRRVKAILAPKAGTQGWDALRANVITMVLRSESEDCRLCPGCGTSVNVKRMRSCAQPRAYPRSAAESTIVGVVAGEFDRIPGQRHFSRLGRL